MKTRALLVLPVAWAMRATLAGCEPSANVLLLCERNRCRWRYNGRCIALWFSDARWKGAI